MYYPIVMTCQIHTDYTVSAHDISTFDKYLVMLVRCTVFFIVLRVAYS